MSEKDAARAAGVSALVLDEHGACRLLEVVEMGDFGAGARQLWSEDEISRLTVELATLRQLGNVIKDTNGLRKFRWSAGGKGKRGGARVIYYYGGDLMPIFLIAVYAKSEKADMTNAEKKAARKLVDTLKREYAPKKGAPQLRVVAYTKGPRRR